MVSERTDNKFQERQDSKKQRRKENKRNAQEEEIKTGHTVQKMFLTVLEKVNY